jgi:hypothetical protein
MSGASHGRHKPASHAGEDRRRAPRLPPSALPPCKARLVGGPEVEIVNVSRTGILTRSGARLMPGSAIGIRFITADTVFVLMGRVVRSRLVALRDGQPQYESALAFDKNLPLLSEEPVAPEVRAAVAAPAPDQSLRPAGAAAGGAAAALPPEPAEIGSPDGEPTVLTVVAFAEERGEDVLRALAINEW